MSTLQEAKMCTTTTPMMDKATKLGGRAWTSRNGSARIYLNDWAELAGLEVNRYGSGHISGASINGESISNSAARQLLGAKAYVDADGLHVDEISGSARYAAPKLVAALVEMLEA